MTKTVADVMKLVKEKECTFVDFRFVDTKGKEQHVSVPISAFNEDKFESGHAFDGSCPQSTPSTGPRSVNGPSGRSLTAKTVRKVEGFSSKAQKVR